MLVNQNGTLLKSEIEGQIRIKAFLSGMPEVRLGLNDRVQFGKVRTMAAFASTLLTALLFYCEQVSGGDEEKDGQARRRGDQRPIELEGESDSVRLVGLLSQLTNVHLLLFCRCVVSFVCAVDGV